MTSPRAELISLLRGDFACPLLAALAELGVMKRMCAGAFTSDDLNVANKATLDASLRYLQSIGLIEATGNNSFCATTTGEYVFERAGVFHLFRSYRDYFDNLAASLSQVETNQTVRRLENVNGTGDMHALKYFPTAFRWFANRDLSCIVDVGCGNGGFLAAALGEHPDTAVVGVDLSAEAVSATQSRLRNTGLNDQARFAVADAFSVTEWATLIPDRGQDVVITIWFILHEFAAGHADKVVRFFEELYQHCPHADVVVGEIVEIAPHALASVRHESVYPEMLLFHAFSGQGVLKWDDHKEWLNRIPYQLAAEERYDEIPIDGELVPSSFVWHLSPNNCVNRSGGSRGI